MRSAALPVLPYGRGTLAELLPSVLAALGVPGPPGEPAPRNVLALPAVPRHCVLLVDGLGRRNLEACAGDAPYLSALLHSTVAGHPTTLTTAFPATTPTSLGSLGTGLPPGSHGLLGFRTAVPGRDAPLDAIHWDDGVDPLRWQPQRTVFERAAAAGVAVTRVAPAAFAGSGLTRAALRGGGYAGAESAGERVADALEALRRGERSLVYVYVSDLDGTGHRRGWRSAAWRAQLHQIDLLAQQIAEGLPPGAALWVTGDHGMLDPGAGDRVDADRVPELRDGVALLVGDPRARYVHVLPGAVDDVLATWRSLLGERMWVLSRDEAVATGWYGEVAAPMLGRIGDVVAVARDSVAVVASVTEPAVSALVGMHGALTDVERLVPLLGVVREA